MLLVKTTKLPLWYLASILFVILLGIINYLGLMNAISIMNIQRALLFQYLDFIVIGVWFVINIIMIAYLSSVNAKKKDYIPPLYFILVHAFYILVIVMNNMGYRISSNTAINISMITSGFEILLAGIYINPYLNRLKQPSKNRKSITKHK